MADTEKTVVPKRVIVESPFAGSLRRNTKYLDACILDSLGRGEAPFASHGFYPRVLDDTVPGQRAQGMDAGFAWGAVAELAAVYVDHGVSSGMRKGIERHKANGVDVDMRTLPPHVMEAL